jgi:hypothetical protein
MPIPDEVKVIEEKIQWKPKVMKRPIAKPFDHEPTDFHHAEINKRLDILERQINNIREILNAHLNSEYAHRR